MPGTNLGTNVVTLIAGEDLRNNVGSVLTLNTSGRVVKTSGNTASGTFPVGVLAMDPDGSAATTGNAVSVALIGSGIATLRAGGTITRGQVLVADDDSGRVVGVDSLADMTADQCGVGLALEAASDGGYFDAILRDIQSATD